MKAKNMLEFLDEIRQEHVDFKEGKIDKSGANTLCRYHANIIRGYATQAAYDRNTSNGITKKIDFLEH